ncbi:hypothetical protein GALL_540260 [mine drainage metagenome]|uniref:Uncharacterized protein n=1 Tax=mine drainage metagenome TaxID=410659 RepID=A0A1J5P005_9ZZZZ
MPLPTRSAKRAATTQPSEVASGNTGLTTAATPYPSAANSLRRPNQSLSAPENTLVIAAVASAIPSMTPTSSVLAPIPTTRYTGKSEWIISDDRSISSDTKPSAHTPAGKARVLLGGRLVGGFVSAGILTDDVIRPCPSTQAQRRDTHRAEPVVR